MSSSYLLPVLSEQSGVIRDVCDPGRGSSDGVDHVRAGPVVHPSGVAGGVVGHDSPGDHGYFLKIYPDFALIGVA